MVDSGGNNKRNDKHGRQTNTTGSLRESLVVSTQTHDDQGEHLVFAQDPYSHQSVPKKQLHHIVSSIPLYDIQELETQKI